MTHNEKVELVNILIVNYLRIDDEAKEWFNNKIYGMKTRVKIIKESKNCGFEFVGEYGFIEQYIENDGTQCAIVKVNGRAFIPSEIVMVPIRDLEILS